MLKCVFTRQKLITTRVSIVTIGPVKILQRCALFQTFSWGVLSVKILILSMNNHTRNYISSLLAEAKIDLKFSSRSSSLKRNVGMIDRITNGIFVLRIAIRRAACSRCIFRSKGTLALIYFTGLLRTRPRKSKRSGPGEQS